MNYDTFMFRHKGVPVMPVGVQVHNSSANRVNELERAFAVAKICHCNSIAIPVYWEKIESEEGKFELDDVGELIRMARKHDLYLFILWFGTWKNGCMKYVPEWVKINKEKYHRVIAKDGTILPVISPLCQNTLQADRKAFCKLIKYIKNIDEEENTVLAVQIENEPGILTGAVRDYSLMAENEFNAPVPEDFCANMKQHPDSNLSRFWKEKGEKRENWKKAFGENAAEYYTAYKLAGYIENIASSGKKIYDLPMYVNVQVELCKWKIPGYNYPSGGAVEKVYDLWKWYAPSLDLLAPDIYLWDYKSYDKCCESYAKGDNALFVPESGPNESNSRYLFEAVGKYRAIGYFLFGAEGILDEKDSLDPEFNHIAGSLQALAAIAPVWNQYRGIKRIGVVNQMEYMAIQRLEFTDYIGFVSFTYGQPEAGDNDNDWNWQDHKHRKYREEQKTCGKRGRGMIIETDQNEFLVLGDAYRVVFVSRKTLEDGLPCNLTSEYLLCRSVAYLSVEEGIYEKSGEFQIKRRRNGDESDFGIWVQPDVGVVKVRLDS